ncbi:MAG TPA: hypothetical protein VEO95_02015 [Chthoniobacteraceae bacterium]|nr:hypothetical protein [Chthoniobacteraceae bacterium]
METLHEKSEWLRAWTIQLACEDGTPSQGVLDEFLRLAKDDPSPVVRLYLDSALQRIAIKERWPLLEALAAHGEDAGDHNLPLMLWFAAEPAVAADVAKAADLLEKCKIPKVQEFITRRIAAVAEVTK